jgi:hypothetical protein
MGREPHVRWGRRAGLGGVVATVVATLAVPTMILARTAQMLSPWSGWMSAIRQRLPAATSGMNPATSLVLVESLVLLGGSLIVGPLLVLGAAALADRAAGSEGLGLRRTFVICCASARCRRSPDARVNLR